MTPRRLSVRPADARGRRIALAAGLVAALGLLALGWLVAPFALALGRIGADPAEAPSRLYGETRRLRPGDAFSADGLVEELEAAGYREVLDGEAASGERNDEALPAGRYRRRSRSVAVRVRPRLTADGPAPATLLEVFFTGGSIDRLRREGRPVELAELEAPLLASYYGDRVEEIWPVRVEELPDHVIDAVLAAEDRSFFRHAGLSLSGAARALLVNLRQGEVEQGGSTLTQQLVKNVYLTPERSLVRKGREAVLALLVEAAHSKRDILQAYLNRIYLGSGHGVNYHGIGAASRAYFSRHPAELTVAEAAVLAGMIRSPANLSPLRGAPSRERRDTILRRMHEEGWLGAEELAAALAEPVAPRPGEPPRRLAPHLARAAAEEARERFGLRRLGGRGYRLLSTLSAGEQAAARRAVQQGLSAPGRDALEAALVSVDPRTGAVTAYVGGRDFAASEFDRVRQARRQPGSAFKPVVLAAALASRTASPASRLADEPLALEAGGRTWRPANHDGRFRGPVTVRTALEQSLNVPVVRLAQQTGLASVSDLARRMGVAGDVPEMPSVALGAFEVSPWELARVYATLAGAGVRPELHTLEAVYDASGRALEADPPAGERVLDPPVAYVTTAVLQGVVDRGTGRAARRWVDDGALAAKTGTSNDGRDLWFAAYDPARVTVVWVGHDDFSPTGLTGAAAALPIWGRFAAAVPRAGVPPFREPPGVAHERVCTVSGRLPVRWCPAARDEVFLEGQVPTEPCDLHRAPPRAEPRRDDGEGFGGWAKRMLRRIFG
ncbi:MAG TPA: transglycosylase domain-containing protein [Thermoanaerobaculia bacterium]|nr:transglycosylase domain-containing protein [Thermoanaerobaculia bacterium]